MFNLPRSVLVILGVIMIGVTAWAGSSWEPVMPASTQAVRPIIRYVDGYENGPQVAAQAAILVDAATGTVLYGKNEHITRAPASTTKIMTAILALERGNLQSEVVISSRACRVGGSSMYLKPGQKFTLWELLQGLMLRSGNDAAVAIAEHLAGSVPVFAAMMSQRAQELGAWRTQFSNPHGLSSPGKPHYTTAFDLVLMARRGMQIPRFRELVRSRQETVPDEEKEWSRLLRNTNRLLWSFPGADGVKTGTTRAAGQCLVSSATRDGWQLIAVVLGSSSRWHDSAALLEYGFRNFVPVQMAAAGEKLLRLPVRDGSKSDVALGVAQNLFLVLKTAELKDLEIRYEAPGYLEQPVMKGDVVGKVRVLTGGTEITSTDLIALEDVLPRPWYKISANIGKEGRTYGTLGARR